MKKPKLYLDTTIWNFAFSDQAPDHKKETLEFFDKARLGLFEIYYSDVVARELKAAPEARQLQVTGLLKEIAPLLLTEADEIDRLATLYLERGVLPIKSKADALHIAHATFHGMDFLLSWNFRHLANVNRRAKVVALNVEQGYNLALQIVTPLEVLYDEKDD